MVLKTLLLLTLSLSINFLLAQQINGITKIDASSGEVTKGVTTDSQGHIYILGWGYNNLEIGGVTYNSAPLSGAYTYLVKLDSNYNVVWLNMYDYVANASDQSYNRIALGNNGDIYITDSYSYHLYLGTTHYYTSGKGYVTYKLNSAGNLQWTKNFGGKSIKFNGNSLELREIWTPSDSINGDYISNPFTTVMWLNLNGNYQDHLQYEDSSYNFEKILARDHNGNYVGYRKGANGTPVSDNLELFRIDSAGTLLQSQVLSVCGSCNTYMSMDVNRQNGDIYLTAKLRNRSPLNSTTGTNQERMMLVKTDSSFNVTNTLILGPSNTGSSSFPDISVKLIGDDLFVQGRMQVDGSGNTHWSNFGPSNYLFPNDDKLVFAKLSSDLNLQWYREIDEGYYAGVIAPPLQHQNEILFHGRCTSFSMDGHSFNAPSPDDVFLLDATDADTNSIRIKGNTFYDTNQDGIQTNADLAKPYQQIKSSLHNNEYYYTDANGQFNLKGFQGNQAIESSKLPQYWARSTTDSVALNINSKDTTVNDINFGFYPVPGVTDMSVDIIPLTGTRPGFQAEYLLQVCNQGTDSSSGLATIKMDTNISYLTASIAPDSVINDTLYYAYSQLSPDSCLQVKVTGSVTSNAFLLGTKFQALAKTQPNQKDTLTQNNIKQLNQTATSSYNPNNLSVSPSCDIPQSFVLEGRKLEYLIRFQNTGSDTVHSVEIIDTLSQNLKAADLQYIASSHDVEVKLEGSVVTFRFNNIQLPNSASGAAKSKGFVKFALPTLPSLQVGDVINNKATILFDYDQPASTNTASTQVVIPNSLANVSAIPADCGNNGAISLDASCLTGRTWVSVDSGGYILNTTGKIENLAPGSYSVRIANYEDTLYYSSITVGSSTIYGSRNISICQGDSIFLEDGYQKQNGTYVDTLQSYQGCDSLVYTTLSVNPSPIVQVQNYLVCQGGIVLIHGVWRSQSGTYYDTLQTQLGCDSMVAETLTIIPHTSSNLNVVSCGEPYTSPSQKYTWNTSGVYKDTIFNNEGCDSLMTINLDVVYVDTTVARSGNTLKANEMGSDVSYQWLDCDNSHQPVAGATGQLFTPQSNGNYAVAVNENGCIDTSRCYSITDIGIENHDITGNIKAYPNPTTGKITVVPAASIGNFQVQVIDFTGKMVENKRFEGDQVFNLNLQGPKGIYIVKILKGGQTLQNLSFIKK